MVLRDEARIARKVALESAKKGEAEEIGEGRASRDLFVTASTLPFVA